MEPPEEATNPWQTILGLLLVAAFASLAYLLVKAVDPGHVAPKSDPGFLDLVVADRTVLTMVRVGVIFGVVYLGWSVLMLMRNGRHLTGVAGVSVSELQAVGEGAVSEQETLEEALEEANRNIEFLLGYIDDLEESMKKHGITADDLDD